MWGRSKRGCANWHAILGGSDLVVGPGARVEVEPAARVKLDRM
jgi:hypothetical protein